MPTQCPLCETQNEIFFQDENFTSTEYKIEQRNNNISSLNESHGYAAKLILESFMREQL